MAMTTTTTTRRGTMERWMAAGALAMALGLGMATAAEAQYQRVQSAPPAVGSQVWGDNGYEYQYTARGYVATGLRKVPNMPQVYDIYNGQTWQKRLDYREPGWVAVLTPAARAPISWVKWPVNQAATEQNSYFLLDNQHWVTMAQLQAMDGQRAPASHGGQYGPGGNTAASQPTVTKAEVDAIMGSSQQRMIALWLQPNCNSSYNGCR
jgi:hypothetical protein